MISFTVLAAALPALLLLWYFRSRDRNPEPSRVVWTTFLLGVVIVLPILVVARPATDFAASIRNPLASSLADAFLAAAIPEEFFKFLVLTLYAARHKEFDEPMDGVVYGAVVSLGFAAFENILYCLDGSVTTQVARALTAVPAHSFTGAIMGYYVGRAKFGGDEGRGRLMLKGLAIATLLHGLYDFPLMALDQARRAGTEDALGGWALLLLGMPVAVLVSEGRWAHHLVRDLGLEQDRALLLANGPDRHAEAAALTHSPGPFGIAVRVAVRIMAGTVLVLAGAFVSLGLVLVRLDEHARGDTSLGVFLVALGGFGLLPAWGGVRMFRSGLHRLHGTPPERVASSLG